MPKQKKEELSSRLGGIIQQKRRKARLYQLHVARYMQRSQPWVARIEAGRHDLTVKDLLRLSQCIGFDPASVIRELEDP